MSVEQTNAASARPLSAASPAAIPCTGPLPSRGSSTTTVPFGRSGRSWPPARTTTTGPSVARATIPTVRRSSVDPCHSSAAFGVPIREDWPPASTTPAEPAMSSWYASSAGAAFGDVDPERTCCLRCWQAVALRLGRARVGRCR